MPNIENDKDLKYFEKGFTDRPILMKMVNLFSMKIMIVMKKIAKALLNVGNSIKKKTKVNKEEVDI